MSKLIEIHMIQNHSPANLNRDELGAPKTCMFGDVLRLRISSQCLKRSIRRSEIFQNVLERDGGTRTRGLITRLSEMSGRDVDFVTGVFRKCGVKPVRDDKPKANEPDNTNILLFLPESAISAMAAALKATKDIAQAADLLTETMGKKAAVPDIALSGRMIELDSGGLFAKLDMHVEAALSAAHAISTHKANVLVDYFTAVDDLHRHGGKDSVSAEDGDSEKNAGKGAGHVDEAQFGSACFYKYFCLDWDQLLENLGGDENLAAATVGYFLIAAAKTVPSGKKNSHASYNEPSGVLVEIKDEKIPTSYANAFAEPARRMGEPPDDAADDVSLVGRSIAQLGDHVFNLRNAHGISSSLLWYSPTLWRYPLRGWERESDGKKKKPLAFVQKENQFDRLGGEQNSAGLVEAVLKTIGYDWNSVRNAGKASAMEA